MATHTLPAFLKQSRAELHNKFVDLEWQQRNRLLQGTQHPLNPNDPPSRFARLTDDAVKERNRYLNVEPFAQNRIKLRVAEGVSDYINASPIQLGKRRYIATQGPKDTNVNHFYRMVASELKSPAVVVMLTQTHEAGREKCFQYYPLSADQSPLTIPLDEQYDDGFEGEVELVGVKHDQKSRSEIRELKVKTTADNGKPREIEMQHLLFSGWPDFLVPEGDDRKALVELVRLSAQLNRKPSSDTSATTNGSSFAGDLARTDQDNPRIVHCSAGVGRSGTFIALDYLLSLLLTGQLDNLSPEDDPIADTVDKLRQQRMMMVQGESQFMFLYEVLREQYLARHQTNGHDTVAGAQG
ncbi:Putative tyrosine-specific protein phosphatase [Septoria linicola]|uniref:Tyrosine-specific protein phosphatase n=1 Tax=Septoria linicola TaxID=215465 RepID=A0A9Q9B8C5_9PEZI|nr:putative tyrosine-specific protein phosphatase [Septoria linicola]USW59263.1 Putative tyrosine-specific protein phosphatase [Septoria linicola]